MTNPDPVQGVISYIGIGSNLGKPADNCLKAIECIASVQGIKFLRRSSLYKTEPVGLKNQDWFVNLVAEIRTILSPPELLRNLMQIEEEMGRVRTAHWGPRMIDLDILLFDQEIVQDDDLVIPHPELHKRRFVLVPLNELASFVIHPAFGISMNGLLKRLQDDSKVERIEES